MASPAIPVASSIGTIGFDREAKPWCPWRGRPGDRCGAVGLDDRDATRAVGEPIKPLELGSGWRLPLREHGKGSLLCLFTLIYKRPHNMEKHLRSFRRSYFHLGREKRLQAFVLMHDHEKAVSPAFESSSPLVSCHRRVRWLIQRLTTPIAPRRSWIRKPGGLFTTTRQARHPPRVADHILGLRREGRTQQIADFLNAAKVPTARGAALWRPSSVRSTYLRLEVLRQGAATSG